ncbi:MAG TPA: valine--tRNA ligase [Candidatus Nanopelagicaceae bacterium]|nr:valine--tRNA ligase [Candidatus Nanopelagicaceae bacterium]
MSTQDANALPPQFVPAEIEAPLYERWVERGYFTADANSDKPPYTIVIPPPNVTGILHMGHALEHTEIDILIRRRRMQGYETLWLPGMDHAGIATQNVVERQLSAEGISRHDLGREDFIERVWKWKAEYGGAILGQMRRLGDSVDWSRERFTMDAGLARAVLTIFKRLYDAGLIYRAERIINWCPRCLTALSDIEVDHDDVEGELVSIRYGDGDSAIVVATTRAETMLGDTAVAVHPDDKRYQHLVGRTIELPLTGRFIPIIADEHVDPEFGTGAVKVTPAHDVNDFEIGLRHGLESRVVIEANAIIFGTDTEFDGLDRFAARAAVVEALRAEGRIVAEKRPYLHAVGHCQRCETAVEPRLSKQWFVKVDVLAKNAGDAVRDGRVRIEPADLEPRYFDWVDNLRDWCISRQLWWGHRIPVWYGPNEEILVLGPDEEAPAGWRQDEDVLDTWFSSGLWPFSTLGWPEKTPEMVKFYPTSVLVTAYDILFFWVVRMMLFGLFVFDGVPPFDVIVLHGLVRDRYGKKMSKSKGNTIDPIEFMDKYGSDALRFSLARNANPGSDQAIAEEWVAGARNFATKLWNATRFALMNGANVTGAIPAPENLSAADRWVLSRLSETTRDVDSLLERFEFAKASEALYRFAWDDVCDWYLELTKATFAEGGAAADVSRRVMGQVFDELLRLLHPTMPFITESLWLHLTGGESIVIADWPEARLDDLDANATAEMAALQELVTEIRRFRNDQGLQPARRIPARLVGLEESVLVTREAEIRSLTRLTVPDDGFSPSASLEIGSFTIEIDLSGTIDVVAEKARLAKDLDAAASEVEQAEARLANDEFRSKAPEAVVKKITDRLAEAHREVARISAALERITQS